jgi:hypothetical protein
MILGSWSGINIIGAESTFMLYRFEEFEAQLITNTQVMNKHND